jgi:hypothetical protein
MKRIPLFIVLGYWACGFLFGATGDYSFKELLPVNRVTQGGELLVVFPREITGWNIAFYNLRMRRLARVTQAATMIDSRVSLRFTVPAELPPGLYILHLQCDQFEKQVKIHVD